MKLKERLYLYHYRDNWADEMDLAGMRIFTESEKNIYFDLFKEHFKKNGYFEFCVGTNQYIEYNKFTDFMKSFCAYVITKDEYKVLKKFTANLGFFPSEDSIEEWDNEE